MRRLLLTYVLFATIAGSSLAGDDDGGTRSPFAMGFGAGELAMGGASISGSHGAAAAYWNPAGLANAPRLAVSGFHTRLFDSDVAYQYLGVSIPTLDFGSFGIGVGRLGIDGIEKVDANNLYIEDIQDNRMGLYLAYGRHISEYRVGLSAHLEHHSLDDYSATSSPGLTLSIGRTWDRSGGLIRSLHFDLIARNMLRPGIELAQTKVEYPMAADFGAAVDMKPKSSWPHTITLAVKATKTEDVDPRWAVGAEYTLCDLMTLRGGLKDRGPSFGVGLHWAMLSFDYAWIDRDMGSLHMFNLTSSFGSSVTERRARRLQHQEEAFNHLMNRRWNERNRKMVDRLSQEGQQAMEAGDLVAATDKLDRALFLARAASMDTTQLSAEAKKARNRLDEVLSHQRYGQYLDSAEARLAENDYVMARHYADLALDEQGNSGQARSLLDRAIRALQAGTARDSLLQDGLVSIDSLLSYGMIDQALAKAEGLTQLAPDNAQVRLARRRTLFEDLRSRAEQAYNRNDYAAADRLVDSALILLPGHRWGEQMRARVQSSENAALSAADPAAKAEPAARIRISDEVRRQAAAIYRKGRAAFEAGDLHRAVAHWEEVQQLAPGYESVGEYLVNAYRFIGVEYYSNNQLEKAVEIWRRAARLNPDNAEINNYIVRAENEIKRLQELSYD